MKLGEKECRADEGMMFVVTQKGYDNSATLRSIGVGNPSDDEDGSWTMRCEIEKGYVEEVPIPGWGTFTGYQVVYNHNGYELSAGNPTTFPTRKIAEAYKKNYEKYPWVTDELYIKEVEYQRAPLEPMKEYNGKPVYNKDYLWWDALEIGDYVDGERADDILNALPPKCMRNDCLQLGEPQETKIDDKTGKYRETYLTIKKVAEDVWEYCGNCFRGENVERGKEIPIV